MCQSAIREKINNQIIEALEKDLVPWRRPWKCNGNGGRHRSFVTGRPYSGVNPLTLELHNLRHGLSSNRWATFKQWKQLGYDVKKRPSDVAPGQWGASIIFYQPTTKTVTDAETGEEDEKRSFILRWFSVFNSDQVVGEAIPEPDREQAQPDGSVPAADELIAATKADIRHGSGDGAFYRRPIPEDAWPNHDDGDFIMLPDRHRFHSAGAYYETVFHELAHWSEIRTGWDSRKHSYSEGELAAEISSCYLASELGVPSEQFDRHVSYLKGWLQEMKANPSFIFKASSQASKTTDFLLSLVASDTPKESANEPVPA